MPGGVIGPSYPVADAVGEVNDSFRGFHFNAYGRGDTPAL